MICLELLDFLHAGARPSLALRIGKKGATVKPNHRHSRGLAPAVRVQWVVRDLQFSGFGDSGACPPVENTFLSLIKEGRNVYLLETRSTQYTIASHR